MTSLIVPGGQGSHDLSSFIALSTRNSVATQELRSVLPADSAPDQPTHYCSLQIREYVRRLTPPQLEPCFPGSVVCLLTKVGLLFGLSLRKYLPEHPASGQLDWSIESIPKFGGGVNAKDLIHRREHISGRGGS